MASYCSHRADNFSATLAHRYRLKRPWRNGTTNLQPSSLRRVFTSFASMGILGPAVLDESASGRAPVRIIPADSVELFEQLNF